MTSAANVAGATRVFTIDSRDLLADSDTAGARDPVATDVTDPHRAISVFDTGFTRGDGVFEGTTIAGGLPLAWQLHVRRLANSMRIVGLPELDPARVHAFVASAIAAVGSDLGERAHLRLVVSRGEDPAFSAVRRRVDNDGSGGQEGRLSVVVMIDSHFAAKPERVAIVTVPHEMSATVASPSWLQRGAKTLSYATNLAMRREYESRGAQNGVWISRDGFVLEGPQSSIVLREGRRFVTPDPRSGILHGTTQIEVFAWAALNGYEVAYDLVRRERLGEADQVWMMGASGLQEVTAIDGVDVPTDGDFTARIRRDLELDRERIDAWTAAHVGLGEL